MNKKLLTYTITATALFFTFSSVAFAETASTTGPGSGVRGLTKEIVNDLKTTKVAGMNASTTVAREKMKNDKENVRQQMKIVQMAKVVWIRINATIVRLGKIISKLDSRIAKIKSVGGDTTVAEVDSADAKTALKKARADMDDVRTIILSISSTTQTTNIATSTIKSDSQDAEIQIKMAQSDIEKALQSLQGLKAGLQTNKNASSTSSGEANQ